jgi:hypothetical protein
MRRKDKSSNVGSWPRVRKELDQEYEAMAGLDAKPSKDASPARKTSSSRT